MILSTIFWLLIFVLIGFFVAMIISPFESLSWWAGWQTDDDVAEELKEQVGELQTAAAAEENAPPENVDRYLVYLTGIGGFSVDELLPEEVRFLDMLGERLPNIKFVTDIYPYSPTERGLTDHNRMFSWFWQISIDKKLSGGALGFVVNLRNLLQVLVAADHRYGVVFGRGTSEVVIKALERHNYPFGSGMPVTLLGYSGGGEVAVSTAQYLHHAINAPVTIVSLAGVFSADSGLDQVHRMVHVYGSKDTVQHLGVICFPRRWRVMMLSQYNKLRRAGRVQAMNIGTLTHNGPGSYLDGETDYADGVTLLDHSVEQIARAIEDVAKPLP